MIRVLILTSPLTHLINQTTIVHLVFGGHLPVPTSLSRPHLAGWSMATAADRTCSRSGVHQRSSARDPRLAHRTRLVGRASAIMEPSLDPGPQNIYVLAPRLTEPTADKCQPSRRQTLRRWRRIRQTLPTFHLHTGRSSKANHHVTRRTHGGHLASIPVRYTSHAFVWVAVRRNIRQRTLRRLSQQMPIQPPTNCLPHRPHPPHVMSIRIRLST